MAETYTITDVVITGKGKIDLVQKQAPALEEGDAYVAVTDSGVSTGTELMYFNGDSPQLTEELDPELRIFRARRGPDGQLAYPKHEGYMPSGVVMESRNKALPEGTRVAGQYNHTSLHVAKPGEHLVPLPEGFKPIWGIWAGKLGPICMNGILVAADQTLRQDNLPSLEGTLTGQRVVVLGAGMVGLLTGKLAQWAGAGEVMIVDRAEQKLRLKAAKNLGMKPVAWHEDLAFDIKNHWQSTPEETGADIFFQCTGSTALLNLAFRALRPHGVVTDMGFYPPGGPAVRYGAEFHHNQITHRVAQIGSLPPSQTKRWDRLALAKASVEFLQDYGQALEKYTITDIVPFSKAQDAFTRLARRDPKMLQVVLRPDGVVPQATPGQAA